MNNAYEQAYEQNFEKITFSGYCAIRPGILVKIKSWLSIVLYKD